MTKRCLEFWILGFGIYLKFGFWILEFPNAEHWDSGHAVPLAHIDKEH